MLRARQSTDANGRVQRVKDRITIPRRGKLAETARLGVAYDGGEELVTIKMSVI